MRKIIYTVLSLAILSTSFVSCSKDALDPTLDVDRDNEKNPIKTASDLRLITTGAYNTMAYYTYYGKEYIIYNEVRSDNAYSVGYSNRFLNVTEFVLTPTQVYPTNTWRQIYKLINSVNLAINAKDIEGDEAEINQNLGEAYALRALGHFDLLKLYGQHYVNNGGVDALGVPYMTEFATVDIAKSQRKTVKENHDAIMADIDKAVELLRAGTGELSSARINLQSALGMKSRMALYFSGWFPQDITLVRSAAEEALEMDGNVVPIANFYQSFSSLDPQPNSIFELIQYGTQNQSTESLYYIYSGDGYGDVLANEGILDLYTDNDSLDIRGGKNMIGYDDYEDFRNIGKYRKMDDNIKMMRYEEILLNYVEAVFRIDGALDATALGYLNGLAVNRGLEPYTSVTLDDILLERRKELMFEGFRFDDLMRLKMDVPASPMIDADVLYGDTRLAFPIPQSEINVTRIPQNAGY
ncbi:RagB/SusD family nutrient uptake outer membrane protein [Myroides guanonis]|uniref:SusD family protein n=1 Tax=Myroides guanonis TaxID=1150112 RepID=A0A1I3MBX5_9FLAO|nr:RagB/SusD family nutrient uptake outer membrane protein [Myroides guanonis]SFI94604.1 SusD family protein [Myroides guanonis]